MEPIETKEEEFVGFPKTETNFLNNLWGVKYYQETHATDFLLPLQEHDNGKP